MKYIDADELKSKINELRQDWLGNSTGLEVAEEGAELGAAESILDSLDDIIDSLQQERPDKQKDDALEKELEQYRDFHGDWYGHTPDGKYVGDSFDFSDIKEFAQRIYNLK